MDPGEIAFLTIQATAIAGAFGYTHTRIREVRREAIEIADRNKREVNTVADLVRTEFTLRMGKFENMHEKIREDAREDLNRIYDAIAESRESQEAKLDKMRESHERFRDEIRARISESEHRIISTRKG